MNTFFLEYRDPLFSVIIFFVFIFLITFVSYWWGRYKANADDKNLGDFLKQFHSTPSSNELKALIGRGELSEKSWLLLANSYSNNGEYEKSIEIYSAILKLENKTNTKEILFLLGTTYFKAGFLQRAKDIFLEILRNEPRTVQALEYLLLVYEQMRDYESAIDVLVPLEELDQEVFTQKAYLDTMSILNDFKLLPTDKVDELISIYNKTNKNTHLIFEYLFKIDPKKAWKNLDNSKSELLIDILWLVDTKDLDLDIIMKNDCLKELYTARGDLNLAKKSEIFEFDILINLQGKSNASLSFEYICDNCKQISPFAFSRCPKCHTVDNSKVELSLVKDCYRNFSEENNSFQ
ncbi:MAG: tetratricopeptide repeat protein [Campylobacterota bacterium]|nr:tetratricopeptide repeat protein [Campylobacterota bacterium]